MEGGQRQNEYTKNADSFESAFTCSLYSLAASPVEGEAAPR